MDCTLESDGETEPAMVVGDLGIGI